MTKKRIFIAGACRTPVGKFGSRLKSISANELLRTCFKETIKRTGVDEKNISSVVAGTCIHLPEATNIARVALLLAGLKDHEVLAYREKGLLPKDVVMRATTVSIPAYTVSRNCGSGLQAIISGIQSIYSGDEKVVLVGGTESMSNSPGMIRRGSFGYSQQDSIITDSLLRGLTDPLTGELMGLTAEHIVEEYEIKRIDQDAFAAHSHQKAYRAVREGKFKSHIAPVLVREKSFMGTVKEEFIEIDEGPDSRITPEKLSLYPPYFKKDGTVTPGNSCMVNDGAASFLIFSGEAMVEYGFVAEAEILGYGVSALDPSRMGVGPVSAMSAALENAKISKENIDIFEINEAFAATTLAVQNIFGIPDEKLNVYGGAIALGHPVGATGTILAVKAINILKDLGKTRAMISLCVGGGQGIALIIKNIQGEQHAISNS